jgi:hypothetical protein
MGCPINYNIDECSSSEYDLTCDTCHNTCQVSEEQFNKLGDAWEMLDRLEEQYPLTRWQKFKWFFINIYYEIELKLLKLKDKITK